MTTEDLKAIVYDANKAGLAAYNQGRRDAILDVLGAVRRRVAALQPKDFALPDDDAQLAELLPIVRSRGALMALESLARDLAKEP